MRSNRTKGIVTQQSNTRTTITAYIPTYHNELTPLDITTFNPKTAQTLVAKLNRLANICHQHLFTQVTKIPYAAVILKSFKQNSKQSLSKQYKVSIESDTMQKKQCFKSECFTFKYCIVTQVIVKLKKNKKTFSTIHE